MDLSTGLTSSDLLLASTSPIKRARYFLPIDVDTEFQTYNPDVAPLMEEHNLGSITISTQLRAVGLEKGLIFSHWDMEKTGHEPRHNRLYSDWAVIDYLRALGIDASVTIAQTSTERAYLRVLNKKRTVHIILYAHFAVADIPRLFRGPLQQTILEYCRDKVGGASITQKRRLITETRFKGNNKEQTKEFITLPWYLTMEGVDYGIRLTVIDSGALHGPISLNELAQNVGLVLDSKSDLTSEDKSKMLETYYTKSESFDSYALGDVCIYDLLAKNAQKFEEVYKALGINKNQLPKLTIGATIAQLFEQKTFELFREAMEKTGLEEKDLIDLVCKPSSADELMQHGHTTGGINAKVLGGRCYNPRPLDTVDKGIIDDLDIGSCYGEGMRIQDYVYGSPTIIEYPKESKNNGFQSLREFFKTYGKELVSGLWQLWFTVEDLPSPQDFFNSYHPPKKWSDLKTETDLLDSGSWLELPDFTKIYSHQIENGLLTHDGYQWLMFICSKSLRDYILDNSIVTSAMFFPRSKRVKSPIELLQSFQPTEDKNTSEFDSETGNKISIERNGGYWYGINLGKLLVTDLLLLRNKYKKVTKFFGSVRNLKNQGLSEIDLLRKIKEDSNLDKSAKDAMEISGNSLGSLIGDSANFSKHPLDSLFKLCTNTLYGVTISKYFKTSNTVVGNNITARARALAWYMEKGLFTHNSITDGGAFNINRVAYAKPGRRLTDKNTVLVNRKSRTELNHSNVIYRPIGGYDSIEWEGTNQDIVFIKGQDRKILEGPAAKQFIDTLVPVHLREQFPKVDVLWTETSDIYGNKRIGQYGFESKGLVKNSAYHGQSNYIFTEGFHDLYKRGPMFLAMRSYDKGKNIDVIINFLTQLLEHPNQLERQSPFEKTQIIKVGDYRQRFNSFYSNHSFIPGDTLFTCGLLREFSLSQFTFRNRKQRESWEKHITKLKENYGQSIEGYFENKDGTLNYQKMIETVDLAISLGVDNFKTFIDKHRNQPQTDHPNYQQYLDLKQILARYGIINPNLDDCLDFFDSDIDYGDYGKSLFEDSDVADIDSLEDWEFEL